MGNFITCLDVVPVKAPGARAYRRLNRFLLWLSAFAAAASVASAVPELAAPTSADFVLNMESGALVLKWSDKYAGYRVQTSTLDLPVVWSDTSLVPVHSNGWYNVVLTNASAPKSFYRLALSLGPDRILRAREAGAALNCNPATRTGTDDTAVLQGLLDSIDAAGGGTLLLDGVALISDVLIKAEDKAQVADAARTQLAALMVGSNTTIQCETGAGCFLADASNCAMLSNKGINGDPNAPRDTHIRLVGGTWNQNGAHNLMQERSSYGNFNYWCGAMFFGAIDGLTLDGVTVHDAAGLGVMLENGSNITVTNHKATWTWNTGIIHDAIHCWGDLNNVTITHLRVERCGDDFISLNTDEGYASWVGTGVGFPWYTANGPGLRWSFGTRRWPKSARQGALTNFLIEDVTLVACDYGFRSINMGLGNNRVDNITFRNVAADAASFSRSWCRINGPYDRLPAVDVGTFTLDNFSALGGYCNVIIYGQNVTIKNSTWMKPPVTSAVVAWGGTVTLDNIHVISPPAGEGALSMRGNLDHLVVRNCVFENCTPVVNTYGHTIGTVDKGTNNIFINSPWPDEGLNVVENHPPGGVDSGDLVAGATGAQLPVEE